MAENVVLQGGERVFGQGSPQAHRVWRGPPLHSVERRLMQVPLQQATRPHRTPRLQRASLAYFPRAGIYDAAVLLLMAVQTLACRALKRIAGFVVVELRAIEQGAVAAMVYAALGGHVRLNPLLFAGLGLRAIGVSRIGHRVQPGSR